MVANSHKINGSPNYFILPDNYIIQTINDHVDSK